LPRHTGEQQFNAREFIEFAGWFVFDLLGRRIR